MNGIRAVVTGASSGIGRAIAIALAGQGAHVLITHRVSEDRAAATADVVRARGGEAAVVQVDLSSRAACEELAATALDVLGGVDVWVNNAGADILTGPPREWGWERKLDALIAVDLKGTIACSHASAAVMREQPDGGTILNMSWDHVGTGLATENSLLFSAVKGGVLAFSKSLARSLAPAIRVNVLCPGWIETAFGAEADREFYERIERDTPMGRWGTPEDVAAAALYLVSPAAAFVTGQAVNVNGGVVM